MDLLHITDIKELKALAYDAVAMREAAEHNLQLINQRIKEVAEAEEETKEK